MPPPSWLVKMDEPPRPRASFFQAGGSQNRFLSIAGQGPYDPIRGRFVRGSITEQTDLAFKCVDHVLKRCGARRQDVMYCRIYLQSLDTQTITAMDAVYTSFFGDHKPIRTTLGALIFNIDVEIECDALLP